MIALFTLPAAAADGKYDRFHGTWGTAKQCAREPLKPGITVLAEPFEIGSQWLRQGMHWCKLTWGPVEPRENGAFTAAYAACGEDAVRNYFISIERTGDHLTLRWDFPHSNGPLSRCPSS